MGVCSVNGGYRGNTTSSKLQLCDSGSAALCEQIRFFTSCTDPQRLHSQKGYTRWCNRHRSAGTIRDSFLALGGYSARFGGLTWITACPNTARFSGPPVPAASFNPNVRLAIRSAFSTSSTRSSIADGSIDSTCDTTFSLAVAIRSM